MTQVTVSSKYQVVIPREVRQQVPLKMGQRLLVVVKEGVITLLPDRPINALRGFVKGMRVGAFREKKDCP